MTHRDSAAITIVKSPAQPGSGRVFARAGINAIPLMTRRIFLNRGLIAADQLSERQ